MFIRDRFIASLTEKVKDEVISWRRYLHQHPELSFDEVATSQFVYDTLQSIGGLEVTRPTKTSVLARLIGRHSGPTIALRADMDALPITEENNFEFASVNQGIMHACGHDGHTAMLLGVAKVLREVQNEIHGEVRFIFQHAEESYPGGAEELVEAGVIEGVKAVYGIHLWSPLEVGKVSVMPGALMAGPDSFEVRIHGRGGHAAEPHVNIDPIAIGAQVVANLQHIVSRNIDPLEPLVVSVTQFHAGTASNVIPETVEIGGTVRSFKPELRHLVPELMERIIRGVTQAHGATYEFSYRRGYRPVLNDAETTKSVWDTLTKVFEEGTVVQGIPDMGGEDFSAYQAKAPGTFFYVGAGNAEQGITYPHHHPKFTVDEAALSVGVAAFVGIVLKELCHPQYEHSR